MQVQYSKERWNARQFLQDQQKTSALTENEMRKYLKRPELIEADRHATAEAGGRHGTRDALILTLMYRHGFRVREVCRLLWSDIDLEERTILCRRLKRGVDSVHPLSDDEHQKLLAHHGQPGGSPLVFPSERGGQTHRQNVNRIVERASLGIEINVTPHKLRHSTGYALVKAPPAVPQRAGVSGPRRHREHVGLRPRTL
jgi:integrase